MNQPTEQPRMEEVTRHVREIVSSVAGEPLAPDVDGIQHIPLDSLGKLEVLSILELEYGVTLTEEVANQFTSISSIARIVLRARESRNENWRLVL